MKRKLAPMTETPEPIDLEAIDRVIEETDKFIEEMEKETKQEPSADGE